MKKRIVSFTLIFALIVALAACAPEREVPLNEPASVPVSGTPVYEHEILFSYTHGQEAFIESAATLIEWAAHVFIGEVQRISFVVINDETGRAPTEACNPNHLLLVTIYDVLVLHSYKGAPQSNIRVIVGGGRKGYREMEQLSAIIEAGAVSRDGEYRIPINLDISPLEVGKAYLFTVRDLIVEYDGYSNFVGIVSSLHSIIDLGDPHRYTDIEHFSDITALSIISEFGETAVAEFVEFMQARFDTPVGI